MIPTTIAKKFANSEANRWLKVTTEGRAISSCTEPIYLDAQLDKTFSFQKHLESLHQKPALLVGLVRQLAKSSWEAVKKIVRTATFSTCSLYC